MQPPGTVSVRIGALAKWALPETTFQGRTDAALCLLDVQSVPEVAEVGAVFGSAVATPGMMVGKRGVTTGLTFGIVTTTTGSFAGDYPRLPPVTMSNGQLTTRRLLTGQMQIRADFPQFTVFGDAGDSGAVVVDGGNRVVGLYWASGSTSRGDPLVHGVATPASFLKADLPIAFL